MYQRILTSFLKKYKPHQAAIEATCHMLDLSLRYGYAALSWEGW